MVIIMNKNADFSYFQFVSVRFYHVGCVIDHSTEEFMLRVNVLQHHVKQLSKIEGVPFPLFLFSFLFRLPLSQRLQLTKNEHVKEAFEAYSNSFSTVGSLMTDSFDWVPLMLALPLVVWFENYESLTAAQFHQWFERFDRLIRKNVRLNFMSLLPEKYPCHTVLTRKTLRSWCQVAQEMTADLPLEVAWDAAKTRLSKLTNAPRLLYHAHSESRYFNYYFSKCLFSIDYEPPELPAKSVQGDCLPHYPQDALSSYHVEQDPVDTACLYGCQLS